jgi:hypothetical protein
MQEVDTIGFVKKKGALIEIVRIKELENQNKIKIEHHDFENITHPFDADKRLYDLVAKNNSCAAHNRGQWISISAESNNP